MEGEAKDYDTLCGIIHYPYTQSALDSHFPNMEWSDEDVILDIGCGPGRITKNILLPNCPKLKKIVAIDIDPNYIEYARKTYFHEKIEFKTQNILEKPDPEEVGKYDKVVSFHAFHLIPDYEKLFNVISTLLKPGGHFFFIIVPNFRIFSIIRDLSTDKEWTKHIKAEDLLALLPPTVYWEDVETEFKNFVSKFDLRVTNIKCHTLKASYPNKKHFLDISLALFPRTIFENLEPEVKDYLWKQAQPIVFKYCSQEENGEIAVSYEALQVSGTKKT
ncbi:juvenile hormone acid O-methyltransferase-like isoform X2 [Centruroides sculpturatus]|uniref:juvenile hormone acid O-methyltransferase-like isoform X2 n=1 Tax=Centruroides sculpturatus TaxID=218467 RepID=UPI000C6EEFAD|nr:juvenile hormone acid O-methyltransferase-like isoform X2 [Centruroides sculpturatus]